MAAKTEKSVKGSPRFSYRAIKSFEDACKRTGDDPLALPDVSGIPEEFRKPIIAAYKLFIIYKAINNGWRPDWSDSNEWKYYPWYGVLSSGFGFSHSSYSYVHSSSSVGSRLCTDSSEKAVYIAEQFKDLYQDYFLYTE
jgi:hypothetical protein